MKQVAGKFTASFFCSTDQDNNQIASFYTGAMADAGELSFRSVSDCGLAIISPNDPGAMVQYAEECRTLGIRYIFDPGQQCARMSGDELKDGVVGATIVICNDYEFELLKQKTGLDEAAILAHSEALIVTRGEHGSSIITARGRDGRAGGRAATHRRSDRRRRRVSRRAYEGDGARSALSDCARSSAAWRRPTRSNISAARATPTRWPSSWRATKSTSRRSPSRSGRSRFLTVAPSGASW